MRLFLPLFLLMACGNRHDPVAAGHSVLATNTSSTTSDTLIPNTARVIHVFVALCDNKNQGIVPVPAAIGNGQDPANNLYWGCAGGVKGYFKKHANWQLLSTTRDVSKIILERCVFKHKSSNAYIVADAYDGAAIKSCTIDFFHAAAGRNNQSLQVNNVRLGIGGSAQLIAYTGHDGLMDFSLPEYPTKLHDSKRETVILACISKRFFREGIRQAGASPLIWSTGLMSPEAYTLEASIAGWLANESPAQIRQRAAVAYDRYQHCGVKGAARLLVTGW
jgi:hypothetical protein